MSIIYSDSENKNFSGGIDFSKINANNPYRTHLGNYFYLRFISTHEDTSANEKTQARDEMLIAERKMRFWERQANFNQKQKELDIAEQKKKWNI